MFGKVSSLLVFASFLIIQGAFATLVAPIGDLEHLSEIELLYSKYIEAM